MISSPHILASVVSPNAQFSALSSLSCIQPTQYSCFIFFVKSPLYADDTQLFLSFHPSDFHSNISHLQNALQQISSWMTVNLLVLNSSKTEFLLIGLKQQLFKIQDCSLTTTHSARNFGFIFDEHLTFSDQIILLHFLSLATITFVNFAVSARTLTSKQPAPLPPP